MNPPEKEFFCSLCGRLMAYNPKPPPGFWYCTCPNEWKDKKREEFLRKQQERQKGQK